MHLQAERFPAAVHGYMEQIFPLLGVRLISVNDNYDSNNYNGATLGMDLVVSNLVNTMYCRDAGKKLRTANRVKWRKGISTASSAPFGYEQSIQDAVRALHTD